MFFMFNYQPGIESITYSELLTNIKSGQVTSMVIEDRLAT
ncbi:MAG: hypothetical protein II978_06545, partial [Clostridia bacterium]|nr:hypothetical protein [Clostridia bacterium]